MAEAPTLGEQFDMVMERCRELEAALARFADDDLWGHDGYWHQWHGSDDPKEFARNVLRKHEQK